MRRFLVYHNNYISDGSWNKTRRGSPDHKLSTLIILWSGHTHPTASNNYYSIEPVCYDYHYIYTTYLIILWPGGGVGGPGRARKHPPRPPAALSCIS